MAQLGSTNIYGSLTVTSNTTINSPIWVQGGSDAGGNVNRLTTTEGMPSGMEYGSNRRGTMIYSNGIAMCDPYNGNSNNDGAWIRHIEETANSGYLEIAVGDDSNESIVVRQYHTSNNIARQADLLDSSGNTSFPGTVSASGGFTGNLTGDVTGNVSGSSGSCTGNAATATRLKNVITLKTTDGNYSSSTVNFDGSDSVSIPLPDYIDRTVRNADHITTILNTSTDSFLPVLFGLTPPDSARDNLSIHQNPNIYVKPSVGSLTANAVYGAYWNDLADSIPLGEGDIVEPGYCYCFDGEHYTKTSKYMQQSYIGIHSDTYGFRMGFEKEKEKLDVAVSGFALAYVDKEYPVGTPLTCTKNGYLTEISKEDKRNNPEMVIAKYWKSEPNEEWGIDNRKVKVNGRKWVKIK